jgi:membrane protein YqaA with SNARE-associated domain
MVQVALSVLSVIGALVGVTLGAILTARSQRIAWDRQETLKSIQEQRTT